MRSAHALGLAFVMVGCLGPADPVDSAVEQGVKVTRTRPTVPTGLVASAGDQTVTLAWNPNPGTDRVVRYQVYRDDAQIADGPTTSVFVDTGLTNGVAHTWRVSALNVVGYGDWTAAL